MTYYELQEIDEFGQIEILDNCEADNAYEASIVFERRGWKPDPSREIASDNSRCKF